MKVSTSSLFGNLRARGASGFVGIFPKDTLRALKKLHRYMRGQCNSVRYRGNSVQCPCCNKTFRTFIPFKLDKAEKNESRFMEHYENTVCPNCYSLPRHRIVCDYLNKNKAAIKTSNTEILMVGAEQSIEKWFRDNDFHYTTADLFDRAADMKVDIQKTQFADERWSLITCNHVLEHVPDYKMALKELRRILKKDGILELSIPTDKSLDTTMEDTGTMTAKQRIQKFGQINHLRIFGIDFESLLVANGFSVETIDGDRLPGKLGAKVGPANYDDNKIYICRKDHPSTEISTYSQVSNLGN